MKESYKTTFSSKIAVGFILVLTILAFSLVVTLFELNKIKVTAGQVKFLRFPTSQSSLSLLNGVNHSLAALRGWLLVGSGEAGQKFKFERKKAWRDEIHKSLATLDQLSKNWTNQENRARLKKIKYLLNNFENYQEEIEGLTNLSSDMKSIYWRQAKILLRAKAAPEAFKIKEVVTLMIKNQTLLIQTDFEKNIAELEYLKAILIALFFLGIILAIFIGYRIVLSIREPIESLISNINAMSKGQFDLSFSESQIIEIDKLSHSVQLMKDNLLHKNLELKNEKDKLEEEDWIKTNLAYISENLPHHKEIRIFANDLLTRFVHILDGEFGGFFIKESLHEKKFILFGQYAARPEDILKKSFQLGEGMSGQCAIEKKVMVVSNISDKYFQINSALGSHPPSEIVLLPIVFEEMALGVLEVGISYKMTSLQRQLMDKLVFTLGGVLNSLLAHLEMEKMAQFLKIQDFALNQHSLVSIADISGRITYANEKFCATSGYKIEELQGKDHRIVNSGIHSKAFFKELWETIKSGKPWKGEICNKSKKGSIYWVAAIIIGYKDVNGNINQYVAIRTDITESKQNQKRLQRAIEESKVLAEAKGHFLANMSHEIRTPMNGVLGMISLLEDTEVTSEQSGYLKTVRSCGDDLLVIINDILDFSKLEAGKMELEVKPFDLGQSLQDVVQMLGTLASKKGIALSFDVEDQVPNLYLGDITRVRQVLINLVNNGIKFTPKGSVKIHVSQTSTPEGVERLRFAIIDTGIGIGKDDQSKLFKSFSQVDASIGRKYGGTGLGLAICYKISSLMEGELWLESEVGRGTTFFFEIPLKILNHSQSHIGQQFQVTGNQKEFVDDFPLQILVVEDNVVNQKVLQLLLEKMKCSVMVANNGQESLELLETNTFDLIFMDMQMPVMDGLTATSKIIERFGDARPYIVATTANVLKGDIEICLSAGMDAFISKPITKPSVREQLLKVFTAKKIRLQAK